MALVAASMLASRIAAVRSLSPVLPAVSWPALVCIIRAQVADDRSTDRSDLPTIPAICRRPHVAALLGRSRPGAHITTLAGS